MIRHVCLLYNGHITYYFVKLVALRSACEILHVVANHLRSYLLESAFALEPSLFPLRLCETRKILSLLVCLFVLFPFFKRFAYRFILKQPCPKLIHRRNNVALFSDKKSIETTT